MRSRPTEGQAPTYAWREDLSNSERGDPAFISGAKPMVTGGSIIPPR